nr:immunoglobulin light chain junction region [Macaca mulatta]
DYFCSAGDTTLSRVLF